MIAKQTYWLIAVIGVISTALPFRYAYAQDIDTLTFTDSVLVNTDGDTQADIDNDIIDEDHAAATNGSGVWVAAWERKPGNNAVNQDIYFARSNDDAQTWTDPTLLHVNVGRIDQSPHVETDGQGTWVIAFSSRIGDVSNFQDVLFCRSTDNGQTFSAAQELNILAPNGFNNDFNLNPRLATDRNGVWMAVWSMDGRASDGIAGIDIEIFGATSIDDGATWGTPFPVNVDAFTDSRADGFPDIASDGAGNWIAVWERAGDIDPVGADKDIYYAISSNNGSSWTFLDTLNSNASTDESNGTLDQDQVPRIESNKRQQWLATWRRSGGVTDDAEHAYATLNDNGSQWSGVMTFQPLGGENDVDSIPDIAADRFGNWIAAWNQTVGAFDEAVRSLVVAVSRDRAQSWSPPQSIPETIRVGGLGGIGSLAIPVTSNSGDAFIFWRAGDEADLTTPKDSDIRVNKAFLSGGIEGRVTAGSKGVGCAFVVASTTDPEFEKVVATDVNGFYLLEGLPAGSYTLTAGGPDLASTRVTITIEAGITKSRDFALSGQSSTNSISGVVSDIDSGDPLSGVRVVATMSGNQVGATFTCATGTYQLANVLKGGEQVDLDFTQPGYQPESESVNLGPSEDLTTDVDMQKAFGFPGTLTGVVSQSGSKGGFVSNARLELTGYTGMTTFADINGAYAFDALPEGQYEVRASAEGFLSDTKSIVVPNSDVAVLLFALDGTDSTDINSDFTTNSLDIQLVINRVLGLDIGSLDADVNGDDAINSVDIQIVINTILGV